MNNFNHLKNFTQMHGIDPKTVEEATVLTKNLEDFVVGWLSAIEGASSNHKTEAGSAHHHTTPDAAKNPANTTTPTTPGKFPKLGMTVKWRASGSADGKFPKMDRAAIITGVGKDGLVDLCVLNPTGIFFTQGAKFSADETSGSTWGWID